MSPVRVIPSSGWTEIWVCAAEPAVKSCIYMLEVNAYDLA